MNADFVIALAFAFLAGGIACAGVQYAIHYWNYINTLPPRDGYTVVTRNGKQHYRKLANKTQQTESGEAA